MPVEPPQSAWQFPKPEQANAGGVVAVGADLEPATLLAAYRSGIFPMPLAGSDQIAWWSPDPRGIIPLESGIPLSRSLRRSCRRFELTVDVACEAVIEGCADPRRPGGWITEPMRRAYLRLHEMGWVHSVEAWSPTGELAGGLYGVAIGGLFAGESMFHRQRDASKVALVHLVDLLRDAGASLLDVQWCTPHLRSLGAEEIPRSRYLELLADATAEPAPPAFGA